MGDWARLSSVGDLDDVLGQAPLTAVVLDGTGTWADVETAVGLPDVLASCAVSIGVLAGQVRTSRTSLLALGCDLLVARSDTVVDVSDAAVQHVVGTRMPAWVTELPHQVGADLLLSWGLACELTEDPVATADQIAARLSGRSWFALEATVRIMRRLDLDLDAHLVLEADAQMVCLESEEHRAAMRRTP